MQENINNYERKVTCFERIFSYSPFSVVTVVARINGNVTKEMLMNAVFKVQQRHTNLRTRIRKDGEQNPWYTTNDVNYIPTLIVSRESDETWIQVQKEMSQTPFRFEKCPPIRFILVQSPNVSELIILCHHIICDGLSLAYLARDMMIHLGDLEKKAKMLPNPIPIDLNNLPKGVSINPIRKFLINRINERWKKEPVIFDQEDYENINKAYWNQAQNYSY